MPEGHSRVLLVDDDVAVRRAYERLLSRHGFSVETAEDGKAAIAKIAAAPFDVILSDVSMPEMDGLAFLRNVRTHDLDVPVVLMTGDPGLDSAMRAVEYGAFQYLAKPIDADKLDVTLRRAIRLHEMARLKRQALEMFGVEGKRLGDRAGLEARFAMALRLLWVAYQPIVSWKEKRVFGYEALLRSAEPTLANPVECVDVAERLGRLHELGRAVRRRVVQDVEAAPHAGDARVFVNLHASDLNDEDLFDESAPLGRIAHRIVLEITERASLDDVHNVESRVARLRSAGFRVAVDDLGAGYAGLTSFAQIEPDIAKLDMSLVRDVNTQVKKQRIVKSMKSLCDELGMHVVAEGVETPAERDQLAELGCDLFQGYLFARPQRGFPTPCF